MPLKNRLCGASLMTIAPSAIGSFSLYKTACLLVILAGLTLSFNSNASTHSTQTGPQNDFARAVQAVKDKDYQLALNLFEAEAARTEYEAMYNLALLLEVGKGRPQNYRKALYWAYLAHLGNIEQAEALIDKLEDKLNEKQVEEVLGKVEQALLERINTGDFDAIAQYADYFVKMLASPDYPKAYQWYAVAVALGLPDMVTLRDDMEKELDPETVPDLQAQTPALFEKLQRGEAITGQEGKNEN